MPRNKITDEQIKNTLLHKRAVLEEPLQPILDTSGAPTRTPVKRRGELMYDKRYHPPQLQLNISPRINNALNFPAEDIIKLRLQCGRTQTEQAHFLQVNVRTYQAWESRETIPSAPYLTKLQKLRAATYDIHLPEARTITTARVTRGVSIGELAEYCDVTPATVTRWEEGRRTPTPANLLKLAEFCDTVIITGEIQPVEK
jgi:DNA-binding transcriptional regulator YiaG